jgi:hypothetical protein
MCWSEPAQTKNRLQHEAGDGLQNETMGGKPYFLLLPEPAPEDGAGAAAGAAPAAAALMLAFFSS